jgi:hypothetical protein
MAASPRTRHRSRLLRPLVLLALATALAFLGPRLIRAWSALMWTRHHAAQTPNALGESAAEAARWAVRTLRLSAPLPWGADACRLALDVGQRQEDSNPTAALALYEQVGKALDGMAADRWRGLGLAALRDEAHRREQALRERPDVVR